MAVALSGSPRTTPPAATSQVSKTFDTTLLLGMTGIASGDVPNLYLAFGQHATVPSSYANLSATDEGMAVDAADWTTFNVTTPFGTSISSINVAGRLAAANFAAWTPGTPAWLALFNTSTPPSAGDVPIATAGPFTVVA